MRKLLDEFKKFALRGNVIDMAVGVIIGAAFGKIVSSLVSDMFMPLLTLLTGGIDISNQFLALNGQTYATLAEAQAAGASTLNYGLFIQTIIDFLLIALSIFIFVKAINKFRKKQEAAPAPAARLCDYCREAVADDAVRCPHCTSELKKA